MQGSYVYDSKGNKYLDTLAGLWCTALGMSKLLNLILWSMYQKTGEFWDDAYIFTNHSSCFQVAVSLG